MFSKLAQDKKIGEIPVYLQETLKILGFATPGAFSSSDEADLEMIKEAINSKVRSYANRPENDQMKILLTTELEKFDRTLENFELPLGHAFIIRSLQSHFTKESDNKHVQKHSKHNMNEGKDEKEKEKALSKQFLDLAKKSVQKFVTKPISKEPLVKLTKGEWTISCPVCDRNFSVYVQAPCNCCIISNYQKHLKWHRNEKPDENSCDNDFSAIEQNETSNCVSSDISDNEVFITGEDNFEVASTSTFPAPTTVSKRGTNQLEMHERKTRSSSVCFFCNIH